MCLGWVNRVGRVQDPGLEQVEILLGPRGQEARLVDDGVPVRSLRCGLENNLTDSGVPDNPVGTARRRRDRPTHPARRSTKRTPSRRPTTVSAADAEQRPEKGLRGDEWGGL